MEAQALPLRDIHLPETPGYWPLAPGWWILMVLIIIVVALLVRWWIQQKAKQKVIKLLQAEVSTISDKFKTHNDKHLLAADISLLLRKFTKFIMKDDSATTLTGQKWIDYLNNLLGNDVFNQHQKELIQAQFAKDIDFDVPKYIATVRNYLTDTVKKNKSSYLKTKVKSHA